MEIIKTDPYNRVLAVVHLLGGQYGSAELKVSDPRIDEAIRVVLDIEEKIRKKLDVQTQVQDTIDRSGPYANPID